MATETKRIEEVTLYNFASLRSPQYREKGEEEMDVDFIFCDLINSDEEQKVIDKSLLEINNSKDANTINELKAITQIGNIIEVCKKLNEYKYKEINFYKIHHTLLKVDVDSNSEIEIKQIVWKALIKLTKEGGELKFKETLINILRFFHLKKHKKLISHDKWDENIPNYKRLMGSQVVIPKDLFPKEETFFYGERLRENEIKVFPSEILKVDNNLEILKYELLNALPNQKTNLELQIVELSEIRNKLPVENENLQEIFQRPFVCTLLKDGHLLIKFEDNSFIKEKTITDAEIEILEFIIEPYKKNYQTISLKEFDIFFKLTEADIQTIIQKELKELELKGSMKLKNQATYNLKVKLNKIKPFNKEDNSTKLFEGEGFVIIDDGLDYYGSAYAPNGYGVKTLGIAEYRKVVSTISRYIPAEVAKIENVMASEYREMATVKELTKEVTDFESSETSNEKETESISTDRFQMQNEIAQTFINENKTNFDTKISSNFGNTTLDISYGTATINSKNESNKQAVTKAQEITNKAVEKILTKVKKERTVKVTEKFTESNKHGFDNRGNTNHVSGVYRHINAVYKNQVHNYGRRLMYEFAIPEPALFHKLATDTAYDWVALLDKVKKPNNPNDFINDYSEILPTTKLKFESLFGIIMDDYPMAKPESNTFTDNKGGGTQNYSYDYKMPAGFKIISYSLTFENNPYGWYVEFLNKPAGQKQFKISLGNIDLFFNDSGGKYADKVMENEINIKNKFIQPSDLLLSRVNIHAYQVEKFYINVVLQYEPTSDKIVEWQKAQLKKITDKYATDFADYKKQVDDLFEDILLKRQNELVELDKKTPYREIELISLKKNSISYLMDEKNPLNKLRRFGQNLISYRSDLKNIHVQLTHKLDEYTAFARFLEQAFEWNMMSYTFYPFYWAKKTEWKEMYSLNSEDQMFKNFLQAGLARVVVSVRPGFENAVMYYMITGKIWEGGEVPTYGSSLFLSIAAELKENPEYKIEETWESILPTNLIALQSSGVAINQTGLPDLEHNGDLGELIEASSKFPKRKKFLGLF